uniref:Uncharacterized protein n=1 Tax=Arundo donax TaxID=35708 RepID=A0A0A9BR28_ARUDO
MDFIRVKISLVNFMSFLMYVIHKILTQCIRL